MNSSSRVNSVRERSIRALAAMDLVGAGVQREVGVAQDLRAGGSTRRSSARSRARSSRSANGLTR